MIDEMVKRYKKTFPSCINDTINTTDTLFGTFLYHLRLIVHRSKVISILFGIQYDHEIKGKVDLSIDDAWLRRISLSIFEFLKELDHA